MDFQEEDTIMNSETGPATETVSTGPTATTEILQRRRDSLPEKGCFDVTNLLAKLLASDRLEGEEASRGIDHVAILGED